MLFSLIKSVSLSPHSDLSGVNACFNIRVRQNKYRNEYSNGTIMSSIIRSVCPWVTHGSSPHLFLFPVFIELSNMGHTLAPVAAPQAQAPKLKPKEKYSKALIVLVGEAKILIEITESKLTCG